MSKLSWSEQLAVNMSIAQGLSEEEAIENLRKSQEIVKNYQNAIPEIPIGWKIAGWSIALFFGFIFIRIFFTMLAVAEQGI